MGIPITSIFPDKIKDKAYLLYKIQQKHERFNTAKSALLIGAGCSYPILPLGSGLIRVCQQLCFVRVTNPAGAVKIMGDFLRSGDIAALDAAVKAQETDKPELLKFDQYVQREENLLLEKLKRNKEGELEKVKAMITDARWEDFEKQILADSQYGHWMDEFNKSPKERQRLIEAFIENKNPGGAYIVLAYLIEKGLFSNILTSNFDDFINDSLLYYTGTRPRFYADDELSQYISIYSAKPNIIKLHGDYRYANIKNTGDETKKLSKRLGDKLRDLLLELDIIILGYNGADHSIMSILHQVKTPDCELLWCGLDENNVHWRVAHLINNTENSHFIKIKGFDDLMGDFYLEFLKIPPNNLVEKAKRRQEEITEYVKQFNRELRDKAETPEEKERLEKQEKIWELWDEAFKKKDLQKQVQLTTSIIDLYGSSSRAHSSRGNAYLELRLYDKALADFNIAIDSGKGNYLVLKNRGTAYRHLKKYKEAIEDYSMSISMKDDYVPAYISRGLTYRSLKEHELAIADYTKAIALRANYENAYKHRAKCYYELKKYDLALRDAAQAIALKGGYAEAYQLRGDIYKAFNQMGQAAADYEMAKKLKGEKNPGAAA